MPNCKSCGAEIIFATAASGALMPIDAEGAADGNITLLTPTGNLGFVATVLTGADLERARADGEALFKSHFATCPHAGRHRRA